MMPGCSIGASSKKRSELRRENKESQLDKKIFGIDNGRIDIGDVYGNK